MPIVMPGVGDEVNLGTIVGKPGHVGCFSFASGWSWLLYMALVNDGSATTVIKNI